MALTDFLQSAEFQDIVNCYYPTYLRDRETRWQAYRDNLRPYAQAAETAARATERYIVRPIISSHPDRFVCYLDRQPGTTFTKSPKSIDDKIFRYLSRKKIGGREPPTKSFERHLTENTDNPEIFLNTFFQELSDVMGDLARFRIVANFLMDIHDLEKSFRQTALEPPKIVVDPKTEDRIEDDRWETGAGGHRAVHICIWVQMPGRRIPVEVLILSALELGWDDKAHMLYELMRQGRGDTIDKKTRLKVRAMSDMLYVADALFDEIYRNHFRGDEAE